MCSSTLYLIVVGVISCFLYFIVVNHEYSRLPSQLHPAKIHWVLLILKKPQGKKTTLGCRDFAPCLISLKYHQEEFSGRGIVIDEDTESVEIKCNI